jgi:Acetyltransferase (GNAT) domain
MDRFTIRTESTLYSAMQVNAPPMADPDIEPCINSVFQRDWWLHAVAPDAWSYIIAGDKNKPSAILPIVQSRKFGLRLIKMPVLTYILGPGVAPTDASPTKRISHEMECLEELLDQLPGFDYFSQNFHYKQLLATPLHWRNFEAAAMHTYTIDDLTDTERVWQNYRSSTRSQIRKAQKLVTVTSDASLRDLWNLSAMSFARSEREPAFSLELLQRVDAACQKNGAGKSLFARDATGRLHAAIYIVWDKHSAYYLIGGADQSLRSSGAMSLLMHEAIMHAATVSKRFDVQGCNTKPFEVFKRNFGGNLMTNLRVRGYSRKMRVAHAIRSLIDPASH